MKINIIESEFIGGQFTAAYTVEGDARRREIELPALCTVRCAEQAGLVRIDGSVTERPGNGPYYERQHVRIIEEVRNPVTGEYIDVTPTVPVRVIAEQVAYENPAAIIQVAETIYPEYVGIDFPAAFQVTTVEHIEL